MKERNFTIIALSVFAIERMAVSFLNIFRSSMSQASRNLYLDLVTVVFNWLLPIIVVYRIERRDPNSLGLFVPKSKYVRYALYTIICIAAPAIYFGPSIGLLTDVLEQILFIGLAEEFFYRGYLMTRLCTSLGSTRGLLLNATLFSLAHIVFIVTNEGLRHLDFLAITTLQTFIGGLLLGYLCQRSRNIVPSSVIHISMNLYLSRLVG